MSDNSKFPIDPAALAQVRDQALAAGKKEPASRYLVLAAVADELLQSYKLPSEQRELQKKKYKIVVS